jgi:hypothetical protein
METLTIFPTVQIRGPAAVGGAAAPCVAQAVEPEPVRERPRMAPRVRRPLALVPSRSVAMLAVVALLTWAVVWWIERGRGGDTAVTASATAPAGEAVVR